MTQPTSERTPPEPTPPVLEMRGISKRYPGVVALDDVSLVVRAGEVHVLLGENGAGKSTLMKILGGAVRRDAGEIRLHGRPVEILGPQRARALGISVIYQELNLVPHLSVAENIFLGKTPTRWPGIVDWPRIRREASALLASLGVTLEVDSPIGSLGIAQQQMVEVAKALADDARILVMDEPTSALSEREVEQLFATIERLTANGVAVVYISHRMGEVFRVGKRVTVLRDGRDVATRELAGASVADLVRLMANRSLAEHYPRHLAEAGDELLRVEQLGRAGVLHDITFRLRRGEILGIAGLVGAGRTELARAIVGADRIDTGRVTVRGKATTIRSPKDAVRHRMGFLPEDRKAQGLVLGLALDRNVGLSHLARLARFGVVRRRDERAEAVQAIADLHIRTPGPDQPVVTLSGGNQQKVVLAKWLAAKADIFFFDEPTRGIDIAARHDIYALMNRLVESGAGVIMISSDLPEVIGMSDRILVMRSGTVQAEIPRADASEATVLQAALGVST